MTTPTTADGDAPGTGASPAGPKALYRFNHDYLPPIPFVDALPPAEKPSLGWYAEVIWQILRNIRNRLNWTQQSLARGAAALSFADDGEEEVLELDALGLTEPVDLDELPLAHATPAQADAAAGPVASFGGGLSATLEVARIAAGAIKTGISDPMTLLGIIGKARSVMDPSRPASVDGYLGLFTLIAPPWFGKRAGGAIDDDTFAWMRVAGPNPLVIEGVAAPGAGFPVTEAHYQAAMHDAGDSLARAGVEGRLYLADYRVLDGMANGVAPYPKFSCAPKALFARSRGAGGRRLKPVAIQCGQDATAFAIFTPADGEGWQKAKFAVQSADCNHHEIVSHLARTHLLIGPIAISMHRQLPADHPVSRLLVPHLEGTLAINENARLTMLSKGGAVDRTMAATIEATVAVVGATVATPYFNQGMLPRWLGARRLLGADLEYPYRDDALLVWAAIERWVNGYVHLHYETDAAVAADEALGRWAAEVVAPDGGRVGAFGEDGAGRIHTRAYLIQALTMIVFTASAQHAVVNFGQGEMTLASTTPVAIYAPAPRTHAEGGEGSWREMVAPIDAAIFQLEFLNQLGGVYYTRLGQYPARHFGPREQEALERFQRELAEIGAQIAARNEERPGPFTPLIPSRIPQSINI